MSDKRQKNQLELAFTDESRSEAPRVSAEGTESLAAKRGTESLAIGEQLMEEVCERENCKQALARVKANKGSPGVDGMTVHELSVAAKKCAILAGRKAPLVWLRYGRMGVRRRDITLMTACPLKASPAGRGRTCL